MCSPKGIHISAATPVTLLGLGICTGISSEVISVLHLAVHIRAPL